MITVSFLSVIYEAIILKSFFIDLLLLFSLPGHQQTFPSDCDRSLLEWSQRGQQDGCYVNSVGPRALKNTSMDTRVALSDRPLDNLDWVKWIAPLEMIFHCTVVFLISKTPLITFQKRGQVGLPGACLYMFNTKEVLFIYIKKIQLANRLLPTRCKKTPKQTNKKTPK